MLIVKGRPLSCWFHFPVDLSGYQVMQSAGFAMYRTVDGVQLLGSRVCFGVVMCGLGFMLRQ
jgi:hypothetical protein